MSNLLACPPPPDLPPSDRMHSGHVLRPRVLLLRHAYRKPYVPHGAVVQTQDSAKMFILEAPFQMCITDPCFSKCGSWSSTIAWDC